MEHDAHLSEDVDQVRPVAKMVTLALIAAVLVGSVVYIFFGSSFGASF